MTAVNGFHLLSKKNTNFMRGIAAILVVISHYAEWWAWFVPSDGNRELLRLAMTKTGDYGVAAFLLFSGYGLVVSLRGQPVSLRFIGKRLFNVYLPYIVVMGAIELSTGGFTSVKDFLQFASGYDSWYMCILFLFYLAFFIIWKLCPVRLLRIGLISAFSVGLSWFLFTKGMQEFWYTANIAFVLGTILGEYDTYLKRFTGKIAWIWILVLGGGMIQVIRAGLWLRQPLMEGEFQWGKVAAVLIWSLLIVGITAKIRVFDPIIPLIGKASLYIYLTHQFLFMWVVNNIKNEYSILFLIAAFGTLVISLLLYILLSVAPKKLGMLLFSAEKG